MQNEEKYRGFVLTWGVTHPKTGPVDVHLSSNDRRLLTLLGPSGKLFSGNDYEEGKAKAKARVDELLGG